MCIRDSQYTNLGALKVITTGGITLQDSATAIQRLSQAQFADLEPNGVTAILVSPTEPLKLTVDQYNSLGTVALTAEDMDTSAKRLARIGR